ncbi:MAG: hypothetical protein C4583_12020 [Anaerolineaceae bacterium]|nr:MAG: hypothetical protein C4583_12020 [Anaerolineaceae bacterium]
MSIKIVQNYDSSILTKLQNENGKLVVRASITASDQIPLGPGSCSYDPASATGVLIARREKTPTEMTSQIFQTGIIP